MSGKILIVDGNIDSAHILKEQIEHIDLFKVYISTNHLVLDDLLGGNSFQYLFIDIETISNIDHKVLLNLYPAHPRMNIVVLHWEFNQMVQKIQATLGISRFLIKPVEVDSLKEILQKANQQPEQVVGRESSQC
ncbi:hypothetical protein K8S19_08785 [bacterium]|nr:hypothetical protein [bacterium]